MGAFVGTAGRSFKMKTTIIIALLVVTFHLSSAQTINSFDGIGASQVSNQQIDFDPNGAVGTKQFMEWINNYYQAYDKTTLVPVWPAPQIGTQPWRTSNMPNCYSVGGDGIILFDHLAQRWVIGVRASSNRVAYYCIAISNTDDLASSGLQWYTYQFYLNPVVGTNAQGHPYFPDWPKLGTWPNGYYVSFDLLDTDNNWIPIGILVCAFDRTNMLTGSNQRPPQCFSSPVSIPANGSYYPAHSLIPADIDGTTAPPPSQDEFLVSYQNPPLDGLSTMSNTLNLFDFHLDWTTATNSSLTQSVLSVQEYEPGCYLPTNVGNTACVWEPSINTATGHHYFVWAGGDRLMPRFAYRNFGTYQSYLVSHTVQGGSSTRQTGIRWYELRGSGVPSLFESGTIMPTSNLFLFMPSIAQDHVGNAAVGYSLSSMTLHPSINAAWWNLRSGTAPTRHRIFTGSADEKNSTQWGDYVSMTVDPIDDCTFWYVNEYFATNQTGFPLTWKTRIANFKLSTCP
jgi:hypothetical protein